MALHGQHADQEVRMVPVVEEAALDRDDQLREVGKLVYIKFLPEQYKRSTDYCREHGTLLVDAERALDLPSHQLLEVEEPLQLGFRSGAHPAGK